MRQHRVGSVPADPVEQLERLLGVDRPVPIAEQVVADDVGEPRLQRFAVGTVVDGGAEHGLGTLDALAFDLPPELTAGVVRHGRQRVGERSFGTTAFTLRNGGDRLDDRQRSVVALVLVDHAEAVGERGDRVPPPELGARRTVGDRFPDQFAGVGVGAQQPDDVA
ncbi:MAG: hypothetical protein R2697_00120 [Ilumatobacteraceae bacterium]